jgi:hypothetical protein
MPFVFSRTAEFRFTEHSRPGVHWSAGSFTAVDGRGNGHKNIPYEFAVHTHTHWSLPVYMFVCVSVSVEC